ncbi:helix-turn-helix domain-containing protein [Kribbella sp. CA-293567]|uniref:helix-turn-helix domain-containing protein n=1 Tax=Kribbella sp. CA-293567 TaxID=3002436 RepID=UPI0022DE797B|nr:helix-turn-helix domain-containing protein [Kribbella sp. CA-293567]WBQ04349.1 helix-turn-helix domain-containing protein [Kribbella sp. CA-293567]
MSSGAEPDPLWVADQVAAYLRVPKATLYRWRTMNVGPPAKKVGRHLRYKSSEVISWFDNLDGQVSDDDPA